ncbi:hypothetical protein ACKF11_09150 [Methylobacillus sp. Pita2]|uniref:hypothetical protein n=1 Tax=Methylobacillus sp. Pita2 TaxID=3383245 RepID=UPI0038B49578
MAARKASNTQKIIKHQEKVIQRQQYFLLQHRLKREGGTKDRPETSRKNRPGWACMSLEDSMHAIALMNMVLPPYFT